MDNSFPGGGQPATLQTAGQQLFQKKYNKVKKKSQYILIFKIYLW